MCPRVINTKVLLLVVLNVNHLVEADPAPSITLMFSFGFSNN